MSNMEQKILAEYRSLTGYQLQWGQKNDSHKVMEMQLVIENWIAEKIKIDILVAFGGMGASPIRKINCSLSLEELKAYRIMVADAFKLFEERGWEAWRDAQPKIELFVEGAIEQHVFDALVPFITLKIN